MGQQIGSYLIERQLGQGGFGVVYVGMDVRLNRRAAIKQLLPELSGNREIVERFFNEAKAAAGIDHPGIVEIYDVGWHVDGSAYFAMKLLEGESLAKRLAVTGPLPIQLAATIARQVASALVAAHARGIVHRDLKPDNVILVPDEEVVIGERAIVLDFGIAKLFGDKPAMQKTRTGMLMGTPAYMSPEQCKGAGEVDHRTDIYALGCMLFEMLAGRPPFVGEGAGEVLGMHQFVEAPLLRSLRPDAPAELEALVSHSLAKKLDQRIQLMTELAGELRTFAVGGSRTAERSATSGSHAAEPTPAHLLHAADAVTRDSQPPAPPTAAQPSTLSDGRGEISAPARRSRVPVVIGFAGIAVIAVIIVAIASRGSSSKSPPADAAVATVPADAVAVAVDAPPVAVAVDAATVAVDAPDVTALLAQANQLVADRKWKDALAVTAKIAAVDPDNAKARELASRAEAESEASVADRALTAAIAKNAAAEVKTAYAKIPNDSVYKPEARAHYRRFLAYNVAIAKRMAAKHECAAFQALTTRLGGLFPEIASDLQAVTCTAPVPIVPKPPQPVDFAQAIQDAKEAAKSAQFGKALNLLHPVLVLEPNNQEALMVAAIAACNIKSASKAKRYVSKLESASRRAMARQICLRNGISAP